MELPYEIKVVIENERTCRMYVDSLIARGVQLSVEPEDLHHEQLKSLVEIVYWEIAKREMH